MHNNIKKLRKLKGISVVALAQKIKMSQANLTKIENNQVALKTETASLIAEALGVNVSELLPQPPESGQTKLRLINPGAIKEKREFISFPNFLVPSKATAVYVVTEPGVGEGLAINDTVFIDESVTGYVKDGSYLLFSQNTYYLRRLQNGFDGSILIIGAAPNSAPLKLDSAYCKVRGLVVSVLHQTTL